MTQCDDDFKTRPEHERPELDDESEPVDKYQRVEVVKRTKLTLRPPEEYDIEDDTKEIEVDDLDIAQALKLAQNEGLLQLQLKWVFGKR